MMKLPEHAQILKVSPEFVRDNQYKNHLYHIIDEGIETEEFIYLENLYPESVSEYPSGRRCFFLQINIEWENK